MKERITFASVIRRRLPPWIERQPHPTYRGGVGGDQDTWMERAQ